MAPLSQLPRARTDADFKPSESRRGTAPAHVSRDWVAPLRPVSRPPSSTQPKPGSRPSSSRVMPNLLPGSRPSSSRPMPTPFPQGSLAPSEHSPRVSGEFSWLPPLGKPLQGCRSSPSLRGRSWHSFEPSLDDAKCSEKSWPCSEVPSAKKSVSAGSSIGKPASLAVKKGRNHAVYQRWQVVSSSNRFQSEEVLERDRQRQRAAACDLRSRGGGRHNASPARSHAAALFFGNGAQQEPAHLPPGALQHVARPPSRSMHIMPNNAAGPVTDILGAATEGEGTSQQDSDEGSSATSSEGEADAGSVTSEERSKDGNRRRSSRESEIWKPAMPRKHIPHALGIKRKVEDLPDINTLYEPRELAQLFKCMDAYVHLVLPPGHTHAHTPDMFLAAMLASLNAPSPGRPMTPSNDVGGAGAGYLRDKEGPLVLRPIFCRFLLASKLCGSRDSPHRYQDCVAAFDAHASRYEAFFGMPRNLLLRVLSGIVLPPGCEASLMASAFDVKRQLPQQVRRFLDHHLRAATGHCEARQKALDDSIARLPWVESLVWVDPATLPKVDEEGEEKEEKEKDKEASPPRRRGRLERQDSTRFGQDELGKAPEATLRLPPGLWPPLPPRYVISERGLQQWKDGIRQWEEEVNQQSASTLRALYENTARVVLGELLSSQLLEPEVLHFTSRFLPLFTRIFDEYADEHSADLYPEAGSNSDTGDEGESRGESSRGFNLRSPKGHGPMLMPGEEKTLKPREGPPDLMSFNAFFSFCAEFELFPGHASFDELKQIYDSAETAQELTLDAPEVPRRRTTASASAALASQLPQVDIEFLNKPLWEMSDMELLITFFFAALEQWLESRFLRLADLVAQRMPWSLEELEEGGNSAPQRFPEKRARRSAIAPKEDTSVPPSPMSVPERRRLLVRQETHTELKVKEEKKKEGRLEEKKERKEKGLTVTVKEERNPTVQLPPWLTLSASELLEIASPPGQAPLLSTKELQQCFRMLLKDSRPNPEIAVYQLDKVLSKAKAAYDHASVGDCFMLKPDSVLSASERVTRQFLQALDERLSERAARGGSYKIEGIFGDAAEVTPSMFIRKAISIALSPDMIPAEKDLAMNLAQIGGAPNGNMSRPMAFRVLALAREYKRRQRVQNMKARSALLAQQSLRSAWCPEGSRPSSRRGPLHPPQLRKAFRVAAFVECLVKLALHRLGSKGLLELQRGAPTWWKCTWLLNFLGIRFIEGVRDKEHRQSLKETVGEAQPDVKNKELDFWWYRMHLRDRLQYVAPLERLVLKAPDLFEPLKAEAPIHVSEDRRGTCQECQEKRSPSGWGTPGCLSCSEVESFCLPFDGHVFASLVRNTDVSDLDSRASPTSEQNFSASDDGETAIPFSTEDFERLNDIS